MKPYTKYSEGFKKRALTKVYRQSTVQTTQDVANGLNIGLQPLKTGMKKTQLDSPRSLQSKSKRPQDWRPEERLVALHKS